MEPSSQVLSLVSAFLTEHGLETTSKAMKKELKRKNYTTDLEPLAGGVGLQSIVESWQKEGTQTPTSEGESSAEGDDATSDSGSDSSSSARSNNGDRGTAIKSMPESDSDSDLASGSEPEADSEEEGAVMKVVKLGRAKNRKRERSPAASSSSSSSSASSSDSDADDENEDAPKVNSVRKRSPTAFKPTAISNKPKRKAESSSSESSSSAEDSSEDERPVKRAKVAADSETSSSEGSSEDAEVKPEAADTSSEEEQSTPATSSNEDEQDGDDTDTSSSDEEDDMDEQIKPVQPKSLAKPMSAVPEAPSDSSSNTVMGEVVEREEDPAAVGEGRSANDKYPVSKKKHIGAHPTRLAQISSQATADSHISNAYKSYEYADRAYNDLSVTRGKGFTKEKNKKKRGSYRGGAIDTSGGKSFKFDD